MEIAVKHKYYHKMVPCDVCGKSMRSDNLKRHMQVHKDLRPENKEKVKREQLEQEFLQYNKTYLDKVELGQNISIILREGVVYEEALPKEHQQALKLYRKHKPRTQAYDEQESVYNNDNTD